MRTPSIQDYAVIGNCRSAALISREGSIDWLCWPRFDSASLFGGLLDAKVGGHWFIRPLGPFTAKRRYLDDTNVLETRFETDSGIAVLNDWMPVTDEAQKARQNWPEQELLRLITCERGEVVIDFEFAPRPGYGLARTRVLAANALGWSLEAAGALINLRSEAPLQADGSDTRAQLRLRAGESAAFSLSYAQEAPAVLLPLGSRVREDLQQTADWWSRWAARAKYAGPHRETVVRSALALKLLSYAPSGAIIAAPTTSLPEQFGGALNWDYRYCWLRDASLTSRALFGLGYHEEAGAFVNWLLYATRLRWPHLRSLYDVFGNSPPEEHELRHWSGYRGARPVRVGNAAMHQLQLDVYGEVVEAAAQYALHGGEFDRETARMLVELGEYVTRNWALSDEGIWETRHGRREHTFSRLMCWAALDRLLELNGHSKLRNFPVGHLREVRNRIRQAIEARAWNPRLGSYTQSLDGIRLDATTLLLPWFGFTSAKSSRMRSTWGRVRKELGAGGPLLYRYAARPGEAEGAFGICSFWGVEYLALGGGTVDEAMDAFTRLLGYANDVGLYAEQIDPLTGDAMGNFPQGFTHIGLINAALTLQQRLEAGDEAPLKPSTRTGTHPEATV